ncbi:MAG: hypothetical protein K2M13_01875, partial [Muribaculaceae bacterium]|nr:hypothetical protein [Muribaculaceae bacterium]
QAYSDSLHNHPDWHPFSYLNNSYHRDADMENMIDCGTTLLLSPGVVQVFYGDETGRGLSDARLNVDCNQAFRSDMNWENINHEQLEHFQKLGRIRQANPVIATGKQKTIDTHTCLRYDDNDKVLIRVLPCDSQAIPVDGIFPDGAYVTELYSGSSAIVNNGVVVFPRFENNIAIIKKAKSHSHMLTLMTERADSLED